MPPPRVQTFDLSALPDQLRGPVEQALVKPITLFMDEAARAINRCWARGDTVALFEDVRVDVPADWTSPTMENSWIDGGAVYRKTEGGELELDGKVTAPGGGAVAGTTIFTVPFAPARAGRYLCASTTAVPVDIACRVDVLTTGAVQFRAGTTGVSCPVFLSGIRQPCADPQPYQPAGPFRWPLDLAYPLERRPMGLYLIEARERIPTGSSGVRSPIGGVDWELVEARGVRQLRVRRIAGLAAGKSYILRLAAIGG